MLTFIATPIGNIADITLRAIEVLKKAEVIICEDTRVAKKLVFMLEERVKGVFGKKQYISFFEHNQRKFFSNISPCFFEKEVVYMSDAGMPSISDPGAKLVKYCQKHNIKYDVLPGPNAAITAFVASGFEGEFCFCGFLPSKGSQREEKLKKILNLTKHSILYESPKRIEKLLKEIILIDKNREVFLAKELTKKFQRFFKGKAEEIEIDNPKGEWCVVISPSSSKKDNFDSFLQEIISLEIPTKLKAKILSRLTSFSAKKWYERLVQS